MKTIKEYAADHGISYEAARKQVVRYHEELKGHIARQDKTQLLDDYAVDFLDKRRRENPIIIGAARVEQSNELKAQVEALKTKLLAAQQKIIALQEEQRTAIEAKVRYEALLTAHDENEKQIEALKKQSEIAKQEAESARAETETAKQEAESARAETETAKQEAESARAEMETAKKEAESFKRSWFGFYRKIKK